MAKGYTLVEDSMICFPLVYRIVTLITSGWAIHIAHPSRNQASNLNHVTPNPSHIFSWLDQGNSRQVFQKRKKDGWFEVELRALYHG